MLRAVNRMKNYRRPGQMPDAYASLHFVLYLIILFRDANFLRNHGNRFASKNDSVRLQNTVISVLYGAPG